MKLYHDFTSQEEIDRQYNVEALEPDMQPYVELFVGGSEKARRELECVRCTCWSYSGRNRRRIPHQTAWSSHSGVYSRGLVAQ
jgi:hypothetical protein